MATPVLLSWSGGKDAAWTLHALRQRDDVKGRLRTNTDAALQAGVFGVPTLQVGDALFWGNDAHAFALAVARDAAVLDDPDMQRLATLPVGAARQP